MDAKSVNKYNLHYLSYNGQLDQIIKLQCIEKCINEFDIEGRTALHLACSQNHTNVAKYLINLNADINCEDQNLTTPLHWTVYNNNIDLVKILLDKTNINIHAKDHNGIEPLHLAALKGNIQIIRLIMSACNGIHGQIIDNLGISPLHLASYCGNNDAIEMLLEYFQVNAIDNRSIHVLNLAASCCHSQSVKLLLKNGASSSYADNFDRFPVHWAAVSGDLDIIKCFDISSDLLDKFKCTPLFLATSYGHDEAVSYFLKNMHHINLVSGQSDQYLLLTNLNGPDSVIQKYFDEIGSLPTTLHWAAAFCSIKTMQKLLENDVNIEELGATHNTPLHTTAAFGNRDIIKYLIERGANINALDEDDTTPLHWAIVHRHIDCVRVLLENDANTDQALCWAAAGGDLDIFKLLHETTECDINEHDQEDCDNYSRNPLMWAATCGHANIIEYLLDNGADTNCYDVIHWCAVNGLTNSIRKLIELGVDINECDLGYNRTALHWAAICGNLEIMEYLLSVDGVEVNAVEDQGDLPIHYAVVGKHLEIIRLLIEHGANVNERGDLGRPICMAARDGDLDIIKLLLDADGADINLSEYDDPDTTPIHLAIENRHMNVVDYLIDKGAEKGNFIHRVAEYGNISDLKKYIKSNDDMHALDDCKRTPLFYATHNFENLKYLLSIDGGSDINSRDFKDRTPLYYAIESERSLDCIKYLIENGADVNIQTNPEKNTPLIRAIQIENINVIKLLVESNANLNITDNRKFTPLHHAARITGHIGLQILEYFLSQKVNVNARGIYGVTPLYLAVTTVHYSAYFDNCVKILLDHGAELNILINEDETGNTTPLSRAVRDKNYDLVKLLIIYGADVYLDENIIDYCPDISYIQLLHYAGLRFNRIVSLSQRNLKMDIKCFISYVESNPLKLKQLCRITCREAYGSCYVNVIHNAKYLPNVLREYLLFNPSTE